MRAGARVYTVRRTTDGSPEVLWRDQGGRTAGRKECAVSELIRIIFEYLRSDDGPELFGEFGNDLPEEEMLVLAQGVAEAIVASGWPRPTDG